MRVPPYIRGLMDFFSSGKRAALSLGIIGLALAIASLASSFYAHANNPHHQGPVFEPNGWTYAGGFIVAFAILILLGDFRSSALEQRRQEIEGGQRLRSAEELLENSLKAGSPADGQGGQDKAAAEDMLALAVLWQVTNARLNQYHQIATGQARRSFTSAQVAIAFGFILLIGFAALAFRAHSPTASITISVLGAASAALAGYISRTFIRSQETAAKYLRAYFEQPLEFSRYLAAERLLASQPETKSDERDSLLRVIIEAVVKTTDEPMADSTRLASLVRPQRRSVAERDREGRRDRPLARAVARHHDVDDPRGAGDLAGPAGLEVEREARPANAGGGHRDREIIRPAQAGPPVELGVH